MVNTEIRLITFFAAKGGEAPDSVQKPDGELTGTDHELLIAKFRLKLKKVGKTTRQFRYDINQIPDDYIVEMRNRFNGLHLIECLMTYGWRFVTLYRNKDQDHPQEKEMQKSKMAIWGRLTTSYKKKRRKKQRKKGKI